MRRPTVAPAAPEPTSVVPPLTLADVARSGSVLRAAFDRIAEHAIRDGGATARRLCADFTRRYPDHEDA